MLIFIKALIERSIISQNIDLHMVIHANHIVVDVDHVTYFVATAQMAVTKIGGINGRAPDGPEERGFVVAIKRKDKLIRITLIQKHKNYSTRLIQTEVETLPSMKQINILRANLSIKEIHNFP